MPAAMASGTDAAEVFACWLTVDITFDPSMPSRRATPSRILWLA